jgi:beta-glucosidase-like glycosyl hydrolase
MRFCLILLLSILAAACTRAESRSAKNAPVNGTRRQHWVDSVYSRLNEEERIGQLFMVAAYSGGPNYNAPRIETLIRNHQIGGLIFMQGGPMRQALLTNHFQEMAQVPLLLAMDAEWGLGMRLDSVLNLPKQMTLGAANDTGLAYAMGMAVAYQLKRLGVHVNFAPVVDVNNNPENPIINARSFGEDKKRVTRLAVAYMRGMQDNGVMACAKHFPGHGDVSVDSHKDLPVINKSRAMLDTLELYPFREMMKAGVQSVMVAHLAIPALEREEHVPTTLSKNTVTGLLKNELGFKGLVFTDALDMKGVAKYYQPGEVDVRAFLAGNDVLLFSQDVPTGIAKIKAAIAGGKVSRQDLEARVKKILAAKYNAGLHHFVPIKTDSLTADINHYTRPLNLKVAEAAVTVVRDTRKMLPLKRTSNVLEVIIGEADNLNWKSASAPGITYTEGHYASITMNSDTLYPKAEQIINTLSGEWPEKGKWDVILIRVGGLSFYPGKSYGLNDAAISFLSRVADKPNVIVTLMGNAYALKYVCNANTLICAYEDDPATTIARNKILEGTLKPRGTLPVTPPCLR